MNPPMGMQRYQQQESTELCPGSLHGQESTAVMRERAGSGEMISTLSDCMALAIDSMSLATINALFSFWLP